MGQRAGSSAVAALLIMMNAVGDDSIAGDGVVWAVNVGGGAYAGIDGTRYEADSNVRGGVRLSMETVKGSQDPELYRSYRQGDVRVAYALKNGRYDVTLHFAEPSDSEPPRVFDALINGETVIRSLDVRALRDGKAFSALTITVPDVPVTDERINVSFESISGEPVLSAVVIRHKTPSRAAWELSWSDEFDVDGAPDPARWTADEWPARKVNDEDQAYTSRPQNLRVHDSVLVIEAHREDYRGAAYTSGRLHSSGKGDVLYGRVEVRAKLPRGKGTWAAIWMLPSNPFTYATTCEAGADWQGSETCDAWPNSGEIDILEHVGYQMGHVHGTVHNEAYYWLKWEQRKGRIVLDGLDEAFHVYALEWTPDRIDIFVDDTLYFTYINEGAGWRSWPYDHPFHVILNLAVGGMWGRAGGGIDDNIFPQRMLVDYVRVFKPATR